MDIAKIVSELSFRAVRSSGAGGQNVNKVSSKVILNFEINKSVALSEPEKELLIKNLDSRLSSDQLLILSCDEDRSQLRNKAIITKRFLDIITQALIVPKKRKATKVPRSVIEKRIKAKRNLSEIKQNRRRPNF